MLARLLIVALLTSQALDSCASAADADSFVDVTTRTGEMHSGRIVAWTAESLRLFREESTTIPMADIAAVDFVAQPLRFTAGSYAIQVNNDRYPVAVPKIANEQLTASWTNSPLRPLRSLPLETVRGLIFDLPPARAVIYEQFARLIRAQSGQDTVRFLTGDDLPGELVGMEGGLVEFDGPLGVTKLDQRRLRSLALDPELAATPILPTTRWVALLQDGTRCTARRIVPRDDLSLQIFPVWGDAFFVPWHGIARLSQLTETLQPLSGRTPVEVSYTPFLDGQRAPQANLNIFRQPLSIRGREYAFGIGMTSRMTLTYALEPQDEAFRALVGLDDLANGQGSAIFEIAVDGQPVWTSPELDNETSPLATALIDLKGRQRLSLTVDFGRNGDVADIADWCDALLLRSASASTPPTN